MTICDRNERGGEVERGRGWREEVGGEFERGRERRRFRSQELVAMNSSTGGAGPLPIISTPLSAPVNVTSVTIDTRGIREFGERFPNVKILLIFTCTLNLPLDAVVTLNFELTRSSSNGTVQVGPTFTFSDTIAVLEAEAFSFQFFDSNLEPDNYTYSVQLSTTSLVAITPGVTINNATLSAIAVADD